MKIQQIIILLLIGLLIPVSSSAQDITITPDVLNEIARSVVYIKANRAGQLQATGSGTIVTSTGLIYTARHVIEGADEFQIYLLDSINERPILTYYASPAGWTLEADFATLQIDRDAAGNSLNIEKLALPHLPFALPQRETLRGDDVYIFGYPDIGDGYLVLTYGKISTIQNGEIFDHRIPAWYQSSAEISPGNSGGLAINQYGEWVGIPTEVKKESATGGRLSGILPAVTISAVLDVGLNAVDDVGIVTSSQPLRISITSVEHNVTMQGQQGKGMKITFTLQAIGYKDTPLKAAIFFNQPDGTPFSGRLAPIEYRTPEGYLTIQRIYNPDVDSAIWQNNWVWMPYELIPHETSGRVQAGYVIAAAGVDGQDFSAWSNSVTFELTFSD